VKCCHCSQQLEGEEVEVCRYCKPKFGSRRGIGGLYAPRCEACAESRSHEPADLEAARERLRVG
jgi:hypothetical protein